MPVDQAGNVWAFFSGDPTGNLTPQDMLSQVPTSLYDPVPKYGERANDGLTQLAVSTNPKMNYLWIFFGIFLLLMLLKYASERTGSRMELGHIRVGVWNFVVITVTAILGIAAAKTILNKYHVKGLTDVVTIA